MQQAVELQHSKRKQLYSFFFLGFCLVKSWNTRHKRKESVLQKSHHAIVLRIKSQPLPRQSRMQPIKKLMLNFVAKVVVNVYIYINIYIYKRWHCVLASLDGRENVDNIEKKPKYTWSKKGWIFRFFEHEIIYGIVLTRRFTVFVFFVLALKSSGTERNYMLILF